MEELVAILDELTQRIRDLDREIESLVAMEAKRGGPGSAGAGTTRLAT
jgi:hypothetical protein